MKYIVMVTIIVLLALMLAAPLITVGKLIAKRFKNIADDVEDEGQE